MNAELDPLDSSYNDNSGQENDLYLKQPETFPEVSHRVGIIAILFCCGFAAVAIWMLSNTQGKASGGRRRENVAAQAMQIPSTPPSTEAMPEPAEPTVAEDTTDKLPFSQEEEPITPSGIFIKDLVGTWSVHGAYFVIFEQDNMYYFNFVVSNGFHNHLEFPVPLSAENGEIVAAYDDDGQGNSGIVRISQEEGQFFITARVEDRFLPQYDNYDNLSALIIEHERLVFDEKIPEYPIYKDYLDHQNFGEPVDLIFLKDKEYYEVADSRITLRFVVLDRQSSIKFLLLDYDGDTIYEGEAGLKEVHKDYVILSGYDGTDENISIELKCYYDYTCHLYTSDDKYEGTAFMKA